MAVLKNHQARRAFGIVLCRDVNPVVTRRVREHLACESERTDDLALRHTFLRLGIRAKEINIIRGRGRRARSCEPDSEEINQGHKSPAVRCGGESGLRCAWLASKKSGAHLFQIGFFLGTLIRLEEFNNIFRLEGTI